MELQKNDHVIYELVQHNRSGKHEDRNVTEVPGVVEDPCPGATTCKVKLTNARRTEVVRVLKKKLRLVECRT